MRLPPTPPGHGHHHDGEEEEEGEEDGDGLPCVPDANALDRNTWYHGSRDAIKRLLLSTGEHGHGPANKHNPGYSKLETTTSAKLDWRDVNAAAIVSSPPFVHALFIYPSPRPIPIPPFTQALGQLRDTALLLPFLFTLFLVTGAKQPFLPFRHLCCCATPQPSLPTKLPQLVFGWPTDDFSDSLCLHPTISIYPLPGLTPALSSWSLLAPVRCF